MKAPNPQGRHDRTTRLMTAGRCGTDVDSNRLGVIRLLRGKRGRPSRAPNIWATWLPRLLTGENSCEWAVWFKAHYQDWTRTPSEFNQAEWMLNHTALLNKRKADWKHGGFDVKHRGTEQLPASGQVRHAGGPARPDHAAGRPSGHS